MRYIGRQPPPAAPEVRFLYIDVGCLRGYAKNVLRKYFDRDDYISFSLQSLVNDYARAFYYDASPAKGASETEGEYQARLNDYRAAIDSALKVDRLHVYEGDLRNRSRKRGLEQKMVDVMLTVDMLRHTFHGDVTHATLLASDQDFAPLVEAVVNEGVVVTVLFPPGETSGDLIRAADIRRPLDLRALFQLLSEDTCSRYPLPRSENRNPAVEVEGTRVAAWIEEQSAVHALYRTRSGEWLFTHDSDTRNRYHCWAHSLELLRDYLPTTSSWSIPEAALNEARLAMDEPPSANDSSL